MGEASVNAYLPLSEADRQVMMDTIGVKTFDALLSDIPAEIRDPAISFPKALSEHELEKEIAVLIRMNSVHCSAVSFLGAGVYDHYIPAVVASLASRGEFFTAYTPYQAEASQGTLQVIYEYQTMMANLTGMDVSTASHYDGATSLAEAVLISIAHTKKKRVLMSSTVHPEYRTVVKTYLSAYDCEIIEIGYDTNGGFDRDALAKVFDNDTACFVSQSPNFFGVIEDYAGIRTMLDEAKALFIMVANPMSLGVLKSPGEWGADMACGDAQPFGNGASFGGPHLGYITGTKQFQRKLPGRLAGMTEDADGKRAFVLTLQAREQHIRRARASSNICSNQALCALQACLYLSSVGAKGLKRISEINVENAHYAKQCIQKIAGCRIVFESPVFNEFLVAFKKPVADVLAIGKEQGVHIGVDVSQWYPEMKNTALVCVTETKDAQDIERLAAVLAQATV